MKYQLLLRIGLILILVTGCKQTQIKETDFHLYSARIFTDDGGFYLRNLSCHIKFETLQDYPSGTGGELMYNYMECFTEHISQDVLAKYGKIDTEIKIMR